METTSKTPLETPRGGAIWSAGRGAVSLALGGLTTLEVLTLSLAFVATVGTLWAAGSLEPERLLTDPWLRASWIAAAAGILRPVTWVPYLVLLVPFRLLFRMALRGGSERARNAAANVLTLVTLAGAAAAAILVVDGAGDAVADTLSFATGGGSFAGFERAGEAWNAARGAAVGAAVVLLRIILPPLRPDLSLPDYPVFGLAEGARGRFDRYAFLVVLAAGAFAGVVALVWLR